MPESPAPLFCGKGPEKDFVDYAQKIGLQQEILKKQKRFPHKKC